MLRSPTLHRQEADLYRILAPKEGVFSKPTSDETKVDVEKE